MSVTVFTPTSVAKTSAALKLAEVKINAAAPSAEHAGAEVVAGEMRGRAPYRTGALRNSIQAVGSEAVAGVAYATPVDRGHGSAAPTYFAEEGAKAAEHGVEAAMLAVFRTALGGR